MNFFPRVGVKILAVALAWLLSASPALAAGDIVPRPAFPEGEPRPTAAAPIPHLTGSAIPSNAPHAPDAASQTPPSAPSPTLKLPPEKSLEQIQPAAKPAEQLPAAPAPAAHLPTKTTPAAAPASAPPTTQSAAEAAEQPDVVFDNASKSIPFRRHIQEPGLYLLASDGKTRDDSNGWKLASSHDEKDLRAAAALLSREQKNPRFSSRRLYATGVEMGSERQFTERLHGLLSEAGLERSLFHVLPLSIPRPWTKGYRRAALDRIVYFLPNKQRDYQAPLFAEVGVGAGTTVILEFPNALYLLSSMPRLEAGLVLGMHSALLLFLTIFQRFQVNWLLRARGGKELFSKQILLSLPFVLNYNIFGNFSAIRASRLDLNTALWQLEKFGVTQGLTLILQTIFYSWVVTRAFRGWTADQKSAEDSAAARAWVNVLLLPWLWLDSIFLTQASTASRVLFQAGPFLLTMGHIYLAVLTVAGSVFILYPKLLDATLPVYKRIADLFGRFRSRLQPPK